MRKYLYLVHDLLCIAAALLVALYLRHGFPLIQEFSGPHDLRLLMVVTVATSLVVLPLMRTHSSIWRFTSMSELVDIMIAVAVVVLITNSSLFLISRLAMMPRSVPPMQWALAVAAMSASRLLVRQLLRPAGAKGRHLKALKQHVIVVGAGHTAELYLQFIKRIVQHPVMVEGFVDSDPERTGRMFQKHRILGTPTELPQIIEQFLVHGIHIRQIVLAQLIEELPAKERRLLQQMKDVGTIDIVHFAQHMGPQVQPDTIPDAQDYYHLATTLAQQVYEKPTGLYPRIKRAFDVLAAMLLIVVFSPLLLLTWLIVALDVGLPVIFWQQRPGLFGKPFRLYKFRTMRKAGRKQGEDRLSHKSGDRRRTSAVGRILRGLRFDELPQLFHIIAGTMSFVGPRPLLPEDQPSNGQTRLSVRPGVTGWAQIHGGDALSPEDKLILDIWYIRHLSLWLDVRILFRTLLVVLKADMRKAHVIEQTRESMRKGVSGT